MKPLNLDHDAIHLSSAHAVPVPGFNHDYDGYMARFCTAADPGRIVMTAHTAKSWDVWESHPAGEEVVIVISGKAEFIQLIDGVEQRVVVGPGQAIINPAGVRHTANVIEAFTAVYLTPGPGTEHHPRV